MEKLQLWEDEVKKLQNNIEAQMSLTHWKFKQGIVKNGESLELDDTDWEDKTTTTWSLKEGPAYFRTYLTVPKKIEGIDIENSDIDITFCFPSGVEMFIDGKKVYTHKFWADKIGTPIPLIQKAKAGDKMLIVFKTPAGDGLGYFWAKISISKIETTLFEINSILYQLKFALALAGEKKSLKKYVEKAINIINLDDITQRHWENVLCDIKEAEKILEIFRNDAKKFCIHLIGHAHIDINWLWTYEDTINTCLRDFETVTKLMEKYPDLTFSQSQAHIYKIVEEHNNELFNKVKSRIKEGRWELTASSWVESDLNMIDGESIIRHILYSTKYSLEKLNTKTKIFWSPDTFGHPITIPSILASAGMKYYYFMRCGKGFPLFRWKGIDGSEVISFNSIYNNYILPEKIMPNFIEYLNKYKLHNFLFVYGIGDHGGGPTEKDIKRKNMMEEKPVIPTLVFSTAEKYFNEIEKYRNKIPICKGELNTVYEGCYTTHSDIKKNNRECETLMHTIETLSAITGIDNEKEKKIEEMWQSILFNQFHDILDGSAIHSSYEYSSKLAEGVKKNGEILIKEMMDNLSYKKSKDKIIVFNPLGWKRRFIIPKEIIIDEIDGYGYKTILSKNKMQCQSKVIKKINNDYETEFYRIKIDHTTGLIRTLYDKKNKCNVLVPLYPKSDDISCWLAEKAGNLISVNWEQPHSMSAWNIGNIYRQDYLLDAESIEIEEYPLYTVIKIKRKYMESEILQKIILYSQLPFIDFENEIEWKQEGNNKDGVPMLRVSFNVNMEHPEAYFEVPFGAIKRQITYQEYPALRWAALKDKNYWVTLFNKDKHGYYINGNNLSLTLLRNPYEPDTKPDSGFHHICYRLQFGKLNALEITKLAMEYNTPIITISGETKSEEFYPFLIRGNILPTSFKKAIGRESYILRMVEMFGKEQDIEINFTRPVRKIYISDAIENRIKQIKCSKYNIKITVHPFQILTLDIEL
ncbi:MAG TPA: glycoside hydrolase family 38 C-terminal domain-containing protein [bacterium]|nr:glycoside hydrolase family 38 C-terminal domain-containing protein [bacterium]